MESTIYLIPSVLDESAIETIPLYVLDGIKNCQVFFVENERTARRFLKKMSKEFVIDNYQWILIPKNDEDQKEMIIAFKHSIKEGKNIGIISEAGCPGIADPGQSLVSLAHEHGAKVKPLVGPSSILLALMASGLNGQQFQFVGYLPIELTEKIKALKDLETESKKKNCTQVFIETPYRNDQLLDAITKACLPSTLLCIAANLTASNEMVSTKTIADWKKQLPNLHKQPVIYCMLAK